MEGKTRINLEVGDKAKLYMDKDDILVGTVVDVSLWKRQRGKKGNTYHIKWDNMDLGEGFVRSDDRYLFHFDEKVDAAKLDGL